MNTRLNKIGFSPLPDHREVVSFITNKGEVINSGYFYEKEQPPLFIDPLHGCEHDLLDVLFWKSEDIFSEWVDKEPMPIEHSTVQILTTSMERHTVVYANNVFLKIGDNKYQDKKFLEKDIISYRYLKTAEEEHKTCNNATA